MPARISRPRYIRDQVRQEAALARLSSAAMTLVAARQRQADPLYLTELEYGLHHAGLTCLSAKCTPAQVQAALDHGGLVAPQQQAERTAYLAQIAAGLPEALANIITGPPCSGATGDNTCPSSE